MIFVKKQPPPRPSTLLHNGCGGTVDAVKLVSVAPSLVVRQHLLHIFRMAMLQPACARASDHDDSRMWSYVYM